MAVQAFFCQANSRMRDALHRAFLSRLIGSIMANEHYPKTCLRLPLRGELAGLYLNRMSMSVTC